MEEYYKKALSAAGININNGNLKKIEDLLIKSNSIGAQIDIHDVIKLLTPPCKVNHPAAS